MDHHSPVLRHFRASLEIPTTNASSSNPHRSTDVRIRNRNGNSEYSSRSFRYPTDINNNKTRVLIHPVNPTEHHHHHSMNRFNFILNLPPVSLGFALLQVFLFFTKELLFNITTDEDAYVSWKTVVTQGEIWRLFYAQYFHFSKVLMFFNFVTLMAMGRFLEAKIKKLAYILLILFMSVVSNLLYIFINDMFCSGPFTDYTVGFGTTMFSLRMIHIFTMDSDANNGKGDPNLIFGFLPVHLPVAIAPWQPLLETIFFDVAIIGRCVAANIAGMCAGLVFPYFMKHFRNSIMLPRNPPPPPPRRRSRRTLSRRSSDFSNNNAYGDDPEENGNNNNEQLNNENNLLIYQRLNNRSAR